MKIDGKIEKPISIRLGKEYTIILEDEDGQEKIPLVPGLMLGGEHYGFVLISEHNGKQTETIYSTQCTIQAVGIKDGILKIFEEGKKLPWSFSKTGKLEHSTFDDFTDEFRSQFDGFTENEEMLPGTPTLKNPISIRIAKNPEESMILKDEIVKKNYSLHPGAVFRDVHYGFILIIDTEHGQKEVVYPTQSRIYAAAAERNPYDDLKILEDGKYHPWLFDCKGKLKQEASYNLYSRRDNEFVVEHYDLNVVNEEVSEDRFVVKAK